VSQYPLVAGHEIIGSISAVGSHVKGYEVGDTVGLGWQSGFCMDCASCHSGDHNLCGAAKMTILGRYGGFADKVRADASSVVKIPKGIDKAVAGPLLCGGVTVFNPLMQYNIKPTDKVGVIGIGGLGHLAIQFMRAWGCEVVAFTSNEDKRKEALALGAHDTVDSKDRNALMAQYGQFDLIISTVSVSLDWNSYIAALRPKGRLHFVGVTLEPIELGIFPMMLGQKSVSSSPVGSPLTIEKMLTFAERHGIKPVVEHYNFEQINEAVDRVRKGLARYRVVLSHQ
jgi:uncharacterized zinc-type alcohol dehydrogenase-like protein